MNEKELFEAIGEADDSLLAKTEEKPKKRNTWIKWVSVAAAVCVIGAGINLLVNTPTTTKIWDGGMSAGEVEAGMAEEDFFENEYTAETAAYLLSGAVYPDMPKYPDESSENFDEQYDLWEGFLNEYRYGTPRPYKDAVKAFTDKSMNTFLLNSSGENRIVSPMNIYFALSLLAESADGNGRQQILDLLDAKDIKTLREYSNSMWKINFSDDGAFTSIFSNSVWLSDTLGYNMETLDLLSDSYYADTFSGNMSDAVYSKALQEWLSAKTGGMLEEEAAELEFDPETIFSLASTVYFRGMWEDKFDEENTEEGIFTTSLGEEITCDFMKRENEAYYYWGDNYGAMNMYFSGTSGTSAKMWLFLPDEGVTTDELIESGEISKLINANYNLSNSKRLIVNFALPKFDTAYTVDLKGGLMEMGVTDVFNGQTADFSALLGENSEGAELSKAQHSVRVAIDEEGCTASAFTAMRINGAAPPPDEKIDFTLDRPFVFVIQGVAGDIIFVGVINDPTK